jgi:hypothetical protein
MAQRGVLVGAGGPVGAAAGPEGDLAPLEVLLELAPFLVGRLAVLGLGPDGPALVEECPVTADEIVLEDGLWRSQVSELSE